jgi:hypothetical protein
MLTKTRIVLSALAVAAFAQGAMAEAINPDVSGRALRPEQQQPIVSPALAQGAGAYAYAYAYAPVEPRGVRTAEQPQFDRVTGNIGSY